MPGAATPQATRVQCTSGQMSPKSHAQCSGISVRRSYFSQPSYTHQVMACTGLRKPVDRPGAPGGQGRIGRQQLQQRGSLWRLYPYPVGVSRASTGAKGSCVHVSACAPREASLAPNGALGATAAALRAFGAPGAEGRASGGRVDPAGRGSREAPRTQGPIGPGGVRNARHGLIRLGGFTPSF